LAVAPGLQKGLHRAGKDDEARVLRQEIPWPRKVRRPAEEFAVNEVSDPPKAQADGGGHEGQQIHETIPLELDGADAEDNRENVGVGGIMGIHLAYAGLIGSWTQKRGCKRNSLSRQKPFPARGNGQQGFNIHSVPA